MKLVKNSNLLLVGLSLILSLVSFTGVVNHLPSEAIKTALVVSDFNENTRFFINYQNAIKDSLSYFSKYYTHSFTELHNDYNLKDFTAFKTYTLKTLGLNAEQLHTTHFSVSSHQTFYNYIV